MKPTEKLFDITRLRQRSDEALFGLILVRALDMEFNLVQLSSARRGAGQKGMATQWVWLVGFDMYTDMYVCI